MSAARSRSIDALRAAAALMVVFHHSDAPGMGVPVYQAFLGFFRNYGTLGVDLFFVLSGFCIHWGHSRSAAPFDTRRYLLRRWWRIYPPYFFALGLAVYLNLFTNCIKWNTGGSITWANFGPAQVLSHAFLVHNLFNATLPTISGPFWTIAVEAQFYLLYLCARPLFFSARGWSVIFLSALTLHIAAWRLHDLYYPFQPLQPFQFWLEWLSGAFLAYWLRQGPALAARWPLWLGLCAAFWAASAAFGRNAVILSFPFLLLLQISLEKIWSSPWLRWAPFLGLFSYSIYLTHFLFIDRVRAFILPAIPEGILRSTVSLSAAGFSLAFAYGFFRFFEKPFLDKSSSLKTEAA